MLEVGEAAEAESLLALLPKLTGLGNSASRFRAQPQVHLPSLGPSYPRKYQSSLVCSPPFIIPYSFPPAFPSDLTAYTIRV